MRNTLYFFFLLSVLAAATTNAQSYCDKQAPKISFGGRAPWNIDGKMDDWQTILGKYTGNIAVPYQPPQTSAFNWVIDGQFTENDYDQPQPQSDLHFLSFTHDDYNVYLYFRRQAVDASSNNFYYFLDINSDEVMSDGEPVVHGSFNNKTISALTLSRYVVNKSVNYNNGLLLNVFGDTVGKSKFGNYMHGFQYGATRETGEIEVPIDKFPLPGSLINIFNWASVSGNDKPNKGEVFAAALTEGGYGVELSIPIRYLRLWIPEKQKGKKNFKGKVNAKGRDKVKYEKTEPIKIRTDIFFYHVSMQNNAGPYNPAQVVDNAGSCRGGVGISGSPSVTASIATTVLDPGTSYKFDITYTNLLRKATEIGIEDIFIHRQKNFETPINPTDYFMTIYPDYNCNAKVDHGVEDVRQRFTMNIVNDYVFGQFGFNEATFDYDDTTTITLFPDYYDDQFYQGPTESILPPLDKTCFIAVLNIKPEKAISSFDIAFESSLFFSNGLEACEPSCGGKPINQVGTARTSVGITTLQKIQNVLPDSTMEGSITGINVYPNPSSGNVTVTLPHQEGSAEIMLEDYFGRRVQQWRNFGSERLQMTGLKQGIYILKVQFLRSGKTETRKIVVQ